MSPKEQPISAPATSHPWRTTVIGILALAGAIALGMSIMRGIQIRTTSAASVKESTAELAIPAVSVIHPQRGNPTDELVLSGAIQAYNEAPIYARANGYVKSWTANLGDRVKAGQVLAEIDAPEGDQQVAQAKAAVEQAQAAIAQAQANLQQSKANEGLAKISADRWKQLADQGIVAPQDNDQKQAQYQAQQANTLALERAVNASKATLAASQASAAALEQVQSYRTVRAPFDGVITSRSVDLGALVQGGTTTTQEMFRIANTDKLRLFVSTPEENSRAAVPGLVADMTLIEFPGRTFKARLVRTSGAIDANTRTLLTEFEIDNKDGQLKPGAFAEVHLHLDTPGQPLLIPVGAILFRPEGPQVGVVDDTGKATLRPVTLGKDYGNQIEIVTGLKDSDTVIATPPDSLATGMLVRVVSNDKDHPHGAE
jgi:RND family efflux transporter MFP subunit